MPEEIEQWDEKRPDILRFVADGKIWMDPETSAQLPVCPWLRKAPGSARYTCDIYEDRPDDCRYYPVTLAQMVADDCEMLEAADLRFPKQAQKKLDRLMLDSRPGLE